MEHNQHIIEQIKTQKVLPLFFHADKTVSVEVVKALYRAGIRSIEYTNRGETAFDNFKALIQERDKNLPDLLLGIGTIRTARQANDFINAGADFLVSPMFDASVADAAYTNKKLWMPGCMTPTEIHVAENAGCKAIKIFPGNVLGVGFMQTIREIFPQLNFMITGGVDATEESIKGWLAAGAGAVGIGGKLIDKKALAEKDYDAILNKTADVLNIISSI